MVNIFYPLIIFEKNLHRSHLTDFLIRLFATLINLDSVYKFQKKIHQQLLFKTIKNLEVLYETIRKIHDLWKATAGKIQRDIRRYYSSIEWHFLLDSINVEYCNFISVSWRTLSLQVICLKTRSPFDIRKTRMVRLRKEVKFS